MLCFKVNWDAGMDLGGKMSLLSPQLWGLSLLLVDPTGDAAPLQEHRKWKTPPNPKISVLPGSRQSGSAVLPTFPGSSPRQGWEVHFPQPGDVSLPGPVPHPELLPSLSCPGATAAHALFTTLFLQAKLFISLVGPFLGSLIRVS